MKVTYNIAQNKFNANLNQETTEIKVKFQTGYYPLPGGGGGVVDTSNLVPYTGANKDVNIASNYFESSAGFKKTGGDSTQYLMADGSTSTLPTDLITGTGSNDYLATFSASGKIRNSLIREEGYRIVVNGGAIFKTNSGISLSAISGDSSGGFVFQNASYQEQGRMYSTNDALIFSAGINPSPKMVIRTNGIGINIPTLNPTEWLEVGGYAKATGFKVANGTATQALTANGGVFDLTKKADLENGKIPATQLPSYVDDVLEFANLASFPATGESGKIYIAIDTNLTYRWGGSSYVVMSSSLALGETSSTAYRGDRGKIAYDHSQVTHDKTLVGLGNVDNTSDLNKPISTATQTALDLKLSIESPTTTGTVISFSTDKVYGTLVTPETGNITADITNAKLGVTNIIIHNSGTIPTFESQFKKLSGSGNYVVGVVNYIYCTFITATEIIYSINQRS